MTNRNTIFATILSVLACFAVLPKMQAAPSASHPDVVPPPDGVYSGNTAEGYNALFSLTTGQFNTAIGWESLATVTTSSFNTGVGAGTLALNTGERNTAAGAGAMLLNTTGSFNEAFGDSALLSNTTGAFNTALGGDALGANTTANDNTAVGSGALATNVTGTGNTGIGRQALLSNSGNGSTALGKFALQNVTSGDSNIGLGNGAGQGLSTGSNNIYVGSDVRSSTESNQIHIGVQATQTATFIAGIFGATTIDAAIPVLVDDTGNLGTVSSSRRFKKDIQPMDKASEAILGLKPVTFHYNSGAGGMRQFGLIAEDVAGVSPDLVVCDKNGEIYTVRYDAVNAMLLNEFLKEHKIVQEQGAMIARQQKQIHALTAGLQRVSAQFEVSKSAPQTALNNQ